MVLAAFVTQRYLPSRIRVSADYARQLLAVCERFSDHLGQPAMLSDLCAPTIAKYLQHYSRRTEARTVNNERQRLFLLWRFAHQSGLVRSAPTPGLVASLPVPERPPHALRIEEIRAVLEYCETLCGDVCGVPAAAWWQSLLLVEYWTAARPGALLSTPRENYCDGIIWIGEPKTGKCQQWRIPRTTCEIIDATNPHEREMLWPWRLHRTSVFHHLRRIMERAGLRPSKTGNNLFYGFKKSCLSYCAAHDPALAQRQADHSNYEITRRHYVDESIAHSLQASDVLPDPLTPSPAPFAFRVVG